MNLATRKQNMIAYLLASVDQDEFDRGMAEYNTDEVLGFTNYQDFVAYQTAAVNQTDEYALQTLEFLRDKIIPNAELVDKESMAGFEASGMVFNHSGKFVFVNER